jgi:hypothetical protein
MNAAFSIDGRPKLENLTERLARRSMTRRAPGGRRTAGGGRHFPLSLDIIGLQVLKLQFMLLDLMAELLGLAAELHAPHLCDPQLQMLDYGGARVQLSLQSHDLLIARQQPCLGRIAVIEELCGGQPG